MNQGLLLEPEVPYELNNTENEAWCISSTQAHYAAGAKFAMHYLGMGAGQQCLVVGSPPLEALALRALGWDVTFLDVRQPPSIEGVRILLADATSIPLGDDSFDAISSTCVLCHVGLGRYGDSLHDNGDVMALREFVRVLRPGGKATIMFGPCVKILNRTLTLGAVNRLYALGDLQKMVAEAGLTIGACGLWEDNDHWADSLECGSEVAWISRNRVEISYSYVTMLLEKA